MMVMTMTVMMMVMMMMMMHYATLTGLVSRSPGMVAKHMGARQPKEPSNQKTSKPCSSTRLYHISPNPD